jgi:beta-glucosidase
MSKTANYLVDLLAMKFKTAFMAAVVLTFSACAGHKSADNTPAIPQDKAIEAKVEKTLKRLSLEEKVGQMMQLSIEVVTLPDKSGLDMEKLQTAIGKYKVGSILNVFARTAQDRFFTADYISQIQELSLQEIGIPCIYGLDMNHGASYIAEGTFFPQGINIAAGFNPEHARTMGEITAYETRAAMCPWTFCPTMDLARNPCWSRFWESFGEDPYLQSVMAATETRALQGDDPNHIGKEHIAVSLKHYMAYSAAISGRDRTPAYVSPSDLREKHFAPFKACIEAGALTLMVNSSSINGVPMHANHELLTVWLKEDLNWDGMIVTDWADINNLWTRERVAANRKEALALGINAGIDMVMEPYDPTACEDIIAAVKEGLIPQKRIDDACRRVLRLKYRLGLFDNPTWDVKAYDKVACEEFKEAALAAAVESQVLLENSGILPLKKGLRILVTGPNGNSIRSLNGGWSYTWQGTAEEKYTAQYNTIYEALKNEFGSVSYVPGVEYVEDYMAWKQEKNINIDAAVSAARRADVIIACVGENSYCETPGNIEDLNLSANQKNLVKALSKVGKPIVLLLNQGRPRIINDIVGLPNIEAVVNVMLPGNYGGDALALLLSGKENFSGKLPFTYSKHVNDLHTYEHKVSENVPTMAGAYNYDATMYVQWPFGAGLSYTTFEYSGLEVDKSEFTADDVLNVKVTVKNTGNLPGKEAVLLYSSDLVASIVPDVRRLRAFTKIELQPGESKVVEFRVPAKDLAFVGADGKWRLEKGDFRLSCGGLGVNTCCTATKIWKKANI